MKRILGIAASTWVLAAGVAQYPLTRSFFIQVDQLKPGIGCIAQDARGLMWAGCDLGLVRTDGVRHDLVLSTAPRAVVAIAADGDRVVAALSSGVIVRCGDASCDTLFADEALAGSPVRALFLVNDALWLGTYGAGAWVVRSGSAIKIGASGGLPDDHVNAMMALDDGRVAIATDQGIAFANEHGRIEEVLDERGGLSDNLVISLARGIDGTLYAGTHRMGMIAIEHGTRTVRTVPGVPAGVPVRALAVGEALAWIGTDDQGTVASTMTGRHGSYLPDSEDLRHQRVACVILADDGAAWWCDGTDRLVRADPHVLFIPRHEGRDLTSITALCADRDDGIWFATGASVFRHATAFTEGEQLQQVDLPLGPQVQVVALHADGAGGVWVGTFGQGVYHIPPNGSPVHYRQADGLVNDNVLAIRSHAGRTWFATLGGICSWSEASGAGAFTTAAIPGSGFVYDILPGPDGVLAATDGNGVLRLAPDGKVTTLSDGGHRTWYSLCMDEDGQAWASGPGTGICRVGRDPIRCIGDEKKVGDDGFYAIAPFHGYIVAFGRTGLIALDRASGRLIDPGHGWGLDGVEAGLNTACTDAHGALWFACDRGLVRLDPEPEALSDQVPVVITGLRWGDTPIPMNGTAGLRHDQNFLTFTFSALRYAAPEEVWFQYHLVGYDASPKLTRDREVSFSRLPPGAYRFALRAGIGDPSVAGEWTWLPFTIRAPWWRRPPSLIVAGLLIVLILVLLVRARDARVRLHERIEKERLRFQLEAVRSQVNPHFLFNSFNTLIELIERDRGLAVEHVEHLSDFFRAILQVRDKDVITLREELGLLENYFILEQRRFGRRIALERAIDPPMLGHGVPPLTLQILVENALKHNAATTAKPLLIHLDARDGWLEVRNDLAPRTATARSTGFGLQSIRHRFALLTDRAVEVTDRAGRFVVRIPLIDPRS